MMQNTPTSTVSKAALPGRDIHPLRSIWRHKFLALTVMIVCAAAAVPLAWIRGTPKYRSECVIYVAPRFARNLEQDPELDFQSNSQYRSFVQQQAKTINRYDIVAAALEQMGPNRDLWQKPNESPRRAAERLQAALDISPVPDTFQIVVGLEGEKPEGLAETVTAAVESFLAASKKEDFYANDRRLADLRREQEKALAQIRESSERRSHIAQEIGITTFTEALPNPYDRLLEASKEALAAARRQRIESEALFAMIEPASASGTSEAAKGVVHAQVAVDPNLSSYAANLNLRRSELLAKIAGLTPDHPGRRAAEEELKTLDSEFRRRSDDLTQSYVKNLLDQRRAEATKAARVEQELAAEVEKQAAQAQWYAANFHEALSLGWEIERDRRRLDSIENRIDFLVLESQAPGFVRMFSRARPPEIPIQGGRRRLFILFVGAAVAAGLLAAVAVDLLDPRVHSPGEAEALLGFPPAAWLPERNDGTQSLYDDQLLRLAICLERDLETHNSRVFCFTSTSPGGGSTTIVLELAKKLTELGLRSVAIEANSVHTDDRYRPPDGKHTDLWAVLAGTAPTQEAIVPATNSLPDRIPLGAVEEGAPWGDLHRIREVLNDLATRYQVVIIDAPPILSSATAEYLSRITAGVLLVARAHSVLRAELKSAARVLERANPGTAGLVLNRLLEPATRSTASNGRRGNAGTSKLFAPWLWK